MPYDTPKRTVDVKPGKKMVGKSGESLTINTMSPRCIADCHTHIESGNCVPLPLLWKRGLESDWIREIIALTKEYPNVYTDFSCWDLDNAKEQFAQVLKDKRYSHLREKILFGTDWFMTLVVRGGKSYRKFCEEFREFFQELPDGKDLWRRFTFINPFTFYGFFDKKPGDQGDKLDNLVAALLKNKCDEDILNENYRCIRRTQKEYEKFKSQGGK